MPSGDLVGTTLKLTTGREVTDTLIFQHELRNYIVSSARSNDDRAQFGECDINRTARQLIDN
jgi:hypothetical protein